MEAWEPVLPVDANDENRALLEKTDYISLFVPLFVCLFVSVFLSLSFCLCLPLCLPPSSPPPTPPPVFGLLPEISVMVHPMCAYGLLLHACVPHVAHTYQARSEHVAHRVSDVVLLFMSRVGR